VLFVGVPAGAGMEIEIKVLGPPELLPAGQQAISLPSQLWCVLVSLLVTPKAPVSIDVLIDRLWDDNPPPKARATIRSYIWRLDRAFSQAGLESLHVSRQAHGYALDVDSFAVDLHRFRSLRRQSDSLAESGEVRQAATLLGEAEALWRGPALAGLPGGWIGRMRDGLEEELRSVTARRIGYELATGHHVNLLAELAELSDRYPADEVLAGHKMVALFRSGRQADALRAYRETRARLVAEGIEPGPALAQLHQRILQHDPELAITPVYRRASRQPNTLPPDIADFVGRAEEMQLLTEDTGLDGRPALRVVVGMGGVGKTSLAVRAALRMTQRFPDAQLFLDFRAHDQLREPLNPADALRDLLTMLDVPARRMPVTLGERAELWRAELASRRAVIIFDDVTGPAQVGPLLPREGDCLIIVTSRRRHPGWGEARPLTLRVFPEEDAAALFTRMAGRAATRDPDHAAKVARLCGCLPLAIRIAATRLRSGAVPSVPDLLDELDEPGTGHADDVSHKVQAAFELSYRQLTPGERHFFRYLGISPCPGLSPGSGAAICGWTVTEAHAALGTLASHHLLEEISPGRFGFHDLVRAFAADRFASEDPEPEARLAVGRLADYYLSAVNHANEVLHGHQGAAQEADGREAQVSLFEETPVAARAWLDSEWGNALRVAQDCGRREWKRRCADLVHALGEFLETAGYWDIALGAHQVALQACRDLEDLDGMARAGFDFSLTALRTGRGETALQHALEAAAIYGRLGDRRGQAAALDRVGIIHRNTARFRDALAHHQEAMDIYRDVRDAAGQAKALVHAGVALGALGRHAEEMSCLRDALSINREIGDLRGEAITLNNIGAAEDRRGYHRDAMRSYQASLDIFRKIGGRQNLAILDNNIALLHQYKGNHRAAIAAYRKVLAVYRSIGDLQYQALVLADIGSAYQSIDRFDEALAHYEQAASLGEAAGDRHVYVKALCGTAEAHFGSGRLNVALESYERAAKLAGEIESLDLKAKALNGIAEIVLHTRGASEARIYLREAHDIFAQLGVPEAEIVEIRLQALDTPAS
jgi:DNA-binding SARP family transcriptional activator/tetratricopeptide (TPR) repeat protein